MRAKLAVISLCFLVLTTLPMRAQNALGGIHGIVIDGRTGSNLASFTVVVLSRTQRWELNGSEHFDLPHLPEGDYVVDISAAGFTLAEGQFHLGPGEMKQFAITLTPEAARKGEVVDVTATAGSDPQDEFGGSVTTLSGKQLLNLSTVLADDPLRAVQSLPGVAADNDFEAKFSLRGQDFSRVGVYLDGIKLPDPLHSFEGAGLPGSASFLNRPMTDELSLYDAPFPERFEGSSSGALDVKLRDGSQDGYHFQGGANFAQANVNAEGPFGGVKSCSWNTGFRKTYLQYVLAGRLPDPSMLFGVQDEQGRASCHPSQNNTISLDVVDSVTTMNQSSAQKTLSPNALMTANQHADVANLGWLYTPNSELLLNTHVAYMRDTFGEDDAAEAPMGAGTYDERALASTAEWFLSSNLLLNAGIDFQGMDAAGNTQRRYSGRYTWFDSYAGKQTLLGGFLQQTFSGAGGRIRAAFSERWDHDSADTQTRLSPAASVTFRVASPLELQVGWGRYTQFPDLSVIASTLGTPSLLPLESTQESAGIAVRFSDTTVLRATYYQRADTNIPYQPYVDPRLVDGLVFAPPTLPMYMNALDGRGRGYEFTLQRKASHKLSGFVSYSYGHTTLHDAVTGTSFPSDWDQRVTITAYSDYAWRRNIDLSSRYTYGSGFPIPGYVTEVNGKFYLTDVRDSIRLPDYQSLDLRLNKTYPHERWRWMLYCEVVNATNHTNAAWGGINGFSMRPNVKLDVSQLSQFPILPSLGLSFIF